ncbi:hypothetical protein [Nonomuraea typhae]|nr:hypothetical protein [Nonomuraea typhae]
MRPQVGKHDDNKKPGDKPLPKQPKPSSDGTQPGGKGDGSHAGGEKK